MSEILAFIHELLPNAQLGTGIGFILDGEEDVDFRGQTEITVIEPNPVDTRKRSKILNHPIGKLPKPFVLAAIAINEKEEGEIDKMCYIAINAYNSPELPQIKTLAEKISKAGYETMLIISHDRRPSRG